MLVEVTRYLVNNTLKLFFDNTVRLDQSVGHNQYFYQREAM